MKEYCFSSLASILDKKVRLRWNIVRRQGRLSKRLANQLIRHRGIHLVTVLDAFCQRRRQLRSEVLLSLIELGGGLRPFTASLLVDTVGELMRKRYVIGQPRGRHYPLKLLPPGASLQAEDLDLYARATALYDYCVDARHFGRQFDREIMLPALQRDGLLAVGPVTP